LTAVVIWVAEPGFDGPLMVVYSVVMAFFAAVVFCVGCYF
jgi:hypothetical protein